MKYIDWHSERVKRIYTGIAFLAVIAAVIGLRFATIWIFDVFILAIAGVAMWEVLKAKQTPKLLEGEKPIKGKKPKGTIDTAVGAVSIFYLISYLFSAYAMVLLGLVTGFSWWLHIVVQIFVLFIFALYTFVMNYMDKLFVRECELKQENPAKTAAKSAWEFTKIVIYPVLLVASFLILNHLGEHATVEQMGELVTVHLVTTLAIMMIFITSMLTDTFAYVTGRVLKSPHMLPKKLQYISPNKSIAGGIGGLFGGVLGAILTLVIVRDVSPLQTLLSEQVAPSSTGVLLVFAAIGLGCSIATQIGDLYASYIKRKTGIKDYGTYLPGHGGIMDRFDGIIFNSVFVTFVFLLVIFV
ncbi:MAG: phosphatidate cytidylyltransferase [Firmicutes bacterium]|nr:phosphatidate cytidylyltransferase [Bacillota bacterium]